MPIEADIKHFQSWALKLGCPLDCLPSQDSLKKTFSSAQGNAFFGIIDKVHTNETVLAIRSNIFISKIKNVQNAQIIYPKALPTELQNFNKVTELKQQIKESKLNIKCNRDNMELTQFKINENNSKKCDLIRKKRLMQAKINILYSKLKSLNTSIEKEKKIRKKIQGIMPVPYNQQSDLATQVEKTRNAIKTATSELNEFYMELDNVDNDIAIGTDNKIWMKLEQTFQHIPNYLLWTTLNRMKDENIETISRLNAFDHSCDELPINPNDSSTIADCFKEFITNAQVKQIAIYLEQVAVSKDLNRLTTQYIPNYHAFMNSIKSKMEMNNDDYDPRTIYEYITQLNAVSFNEGQYEFLIKEFEAKQDECSKESKQLEGHRLMIKQLEEIYIETDQMYSKTRNEVMSLYLIKGKLQHLESSMKELVNETRNLLHSQQNNVGINGTQANVQATPNANSSMSINSFNSSGDNVLCSTKLDNNSMTSYFKHENRSRLNPLPQHVTELTSFLDKSFNKLFAALDDRCHNLSIITSNSTNEPLAHLVNVDLFMAHVVLNQIQNKCEWVKKINDLLIDRKTDIVLRKGNDQQLKEEQQQYANETVELIDKMAVIDVIIDRKLMLAQKYYRFLSQNPLGKFIPKGKTFNGRSFQDYEEEFLLYYNMLQR